MVLPVHFSYASQAWPGQKVNNIHPSNICGYWRGTVDSNARAHRGDLCCRLKQCPQPQLSNFILGHTKLSMQTAQPVWPINLWDPSHKNCAPTEEVNGYIWAHSYINYFKLLFTRLHISSDHEIIANCSFIYKQEKENNNKRCKNKILALQKKPHENHMQGFALVSPVAVSIPCLPKGLKVNISQWQNVLFSLKRLPH